MLRKATTTSIEFVLPARLSSAAFAGPRRSKPDLVPSRQQHERAISPAQWERGKGIGRGRSRALLPDRCSEALRLDLAKTSSSAIAIGYPNLASVINSVITDRSRAILVRVDDHGAFQVLNF